jgi:hypothetical protein
MSTLDDAGSESAFKLVQGKQRKDGLVVNIKQYHSMYQAQMPSPFRVRILGPVWKQMSEEDSVFTTNGLVGTLRPFNKRLTADYNCEANF